MRYENFISNERYLIFGKGINETAIFLDDQDKTRFVFLITHFQSPIRIYNVSWYTESFLKKDVFSLREEKINELIKKRNIKLIAFLLTENSFHLLIQNLENDILSVYMHRILTAYSKYFNAKYKKNGHVFGGPFKSRHVKNNEQLLNFTSFIHKRPKEIKGWEDCYDRYPYSSYQDYIGLNRWGDLLSTEIVLKQFKDPIKYRDFVNSNTTKENLYIF